MAARPSPGSCARSPSCSLPVSGVRRGRDSPHRPLSINPEATGALGPLELARIRGGFMRAALLIFALAATGLAASVTLPRDARAAVDPAVDRGQSVAERRCAECHAIRPGRRSPDGDAPPFSVLRLRYNELSLTRRID